VTDLFVPLDDHPAYRQIANVIEQRIVARSLRTGDPLPSETDLARQFGVNRSTIREAIRELETHGLLGRVRGEKRLRVTRPEPRRVSSGVSRALALHDVTFLELWEAMMAIEPVAAQYAAARRTPAQLQALVRAGARFKREVADTTEAVSGAPALTRMIDRIPQARTRIQTAQGKIADAIKLRRSEQARTWMEKHIRDFKRGHELELI
jgi:GntR family transcriptional repressor for pyruvate dehydrogenase complex